MRTRFSLVFACLLAFLATPSLLAQQRDRKAPDREKAPTRRSERRKPSQAEEKSATARKRKPAEERKTAREKEGTPKTSTKKPTTAKTATKAKPVASKAEAKKPAASRKPAPAPKPAAAKPAATPKPAAAKPAETKPAAAKPAVAKPLAPKPAVRKPDPADAPAPRGSVLAAADRAYTEKSYAVALRSYRDALAKRQVPDARKPQVAIRIAKCLGYTQKWDDATAEAGKVAQQYAGTVWEARTRAWMLELYLRVPDSAWRVGDRYTRAEEMPKPEGDVVPERVYLKDDDRRKAIAFGEQGRALYEKLRDSLSDTAEEADLSADLAKVIGGETLTDWANARQWKSPSDSSWAVDAAAPYDPSWAPPKKVLWLLAAAERQGSDTQKPLARLATALWLRSYHERMSNAARDPRDTRRVLPYPYQNLSALTTLRAFLKEYANSPQADQGQFLLGRWLEADGKYKEALEIYSALAKDHPNGPWTPDANTRAAAITRVGLQLEAPAPQLPGKKALLQLNVRNTESVKFTATRLKLEAALRDARVLNRPRAGISELFARLGQAKGVRAFQQGDPVTWEKSVKPATEHAPEMVSVETPLTENGAYLVEAEAGPVRSAVVLLVSDLAVIQVVDGKQVSAMVVSARTGAPVAEATALIREVYTDEKEKEAVSAARATTEADGLAEKPLSPKGTGSSSVLTVAWKGERYAFTDDSYASRERSETAESKVYVYTERPVYRPGQTVFFRALIAGREKEGALKPLTARKLTVRVTDPKGAEISRQELTTSEFGTVNGKAALSGGAPLGNYAVTVAWGKNLSEGEGSGGFAVEEYKKPEYQVSIAPSADGPPRVGDPFSAKIVARYYFGAPVAGARIRYTVVRSEWFPESPFHPPFQPLYRSGEESKWGGTWFPGRPHFPETTTSGVAVTDARGEAMVSLNTKVDDPRFQGRHLQFFLRAEVTDASRRTITGSGTVRALATQFNAFLQTRRGFYSAGDTVQADLRTLDAEGRPVAVSGTARVLKLKAKLANEETTSYDEPEYDREEVHREAVRTDAQGRGVLTWNNARDGLYELRFEARDAWEQTVTGSVQAWVAGQAAGDGVFHTRHVALTPEETTYRAGDTARLLVVSDEPGATVLLTREAGDLVLERRVIRLEGRSRVLEIPLGMRDTPDVTFAVTGIRNRELFRDTATLSVPPVDQLLNVTLAADKQRYEPGQPAKLQIRARNADGKPVRTEVSVGVVDASLFYIAGEERSAVGGFFYGDERGSDVSAEGSTTSTFDTAEEDSQPPLKETERKWEFPEGFGNLPPELLGEPPLWADAAVWSDFAGYDGVPSTTSAGVGAARKQRLNGRVNGDSGREVAKVPLADSNVKFKREDGALSGEIPSPTLRKAFADTAFWTPAVVTGEDGTATVEFKWPDNLTEWRATTVGWSETAQVGEASTTVTTHKDLLVRLQSPRFFVERDEVVLSANIHNYTGGEQSLRVTLHLGGDSLVAADTAAPGPPGPRRLVVPRADRPMPMGVALLAPAEPGRTTLTSPEDLTQTITVPNEGERRVDWRVRVERPGQATIRVTAQAPSASDAMEQSFPTLVHGVEKLVVRSGAMVAPPGDKGGNRTAKLNVSVPAERAPDSGELVVQVSPTAAGAMLDSLPYVVEYPYGCTEQTLSRFVPAAVVSKTLTELGLNLDALRKRAQAEYARLQEAKPGARPADSAYTYPEGAPGLRDVQRAELERARWQAQRNPVFNPATLKRITAEGLARLQKYQHEDGGWGWWENDPSNGRMTAIAVQGLVIARAVGQTVPASMVEGGFKYLDGRFEKDLDLHELAMLGWTLTLDPKRAKGIAAAVATRVYPKRERLTPYSLALLAMALRNGGRSSEAKVCLDNLENSAKIDAEAGTCHWPQNDGGAWNWYNNDVEATATCLRALLSVNPRHKLAPLVAKWLCGSRSGVAWETTRETALAIQSLADYVRLNKELAPDYTVTVDVGGKFKRAFKVTAENSLLFDNRLVIPGAALGEGALPITVTREGRGNVYYNAYLRYFTLEEGIRAEGSDLKVRRRYFRLAKPEAGSRPKGLTEDGYVRSEVKPGESLTSGDLLEAELLIENKLPYEYLVFEDLKPAGCEPVDLRSGERYAGGLCSNMELRDEKVAFFVTWLPAGRRTLTYRLRAEVPGAFHALPLNAYAMYAPDIRALSDEANLAIEDAPPATPSAPAEP